MFSSLASSFGKKNVFSLRPPYAIDENFFDTICITCKDTPCVQVCEENIILLEDNKPIISFENGGCTYCKECVSACPNEVLNLETNQQINADFTIDTNACLAWNEVVCFTCKDVCDDKAIEFFGTFRPQILKNDCTSCGFCYNPCPTNAIKIQTKEIECELS